MKKSIIRFVLWTSKTCLQFFRDQVEKLTEKFFLSPIVFRLNHYLYNRRCNSTVKLGCPEVFEAISLSEEIC